ncbi:MAG TPA: transcriptional repressor [Pseudonocardiaceae bacterium]|jgi:Fur family ferric uptake transcriptional regulator
MSLDLDPPHDHHRGEYRPSAQRRIILAALAQHPTFITAQALHAQLISNHHTVGLSTIYRTLRLYANRGDIDTTHSDNGTELFRHHPETGHHHHYLRCRACGYSIPIHSDTVEAWTATIGPHHDFTNTTTPSKSSASAAPADTPPTMTPIPPRTHHHTTRDQRDPTNPSTGDNPPPTIVTTQHTPRSPPTGHADVRKCRRTRHSRVGLAP